MLLRLFDWRGRASRAAYWQALGVFSVFVFVGWGIAVVGGLMGRGASVFVMGGLLAVIGCACLAATTVRRVRDRGHSLLRWVALVFGPYLLGTLATAAASEPMLYGLLLLATFAALVWGVVEFGFLPGTPGDKRYGPDPRTSSRVR